MSLKKYYDAIVVGAGLLGTATARELLKRNKKLKLAIVDKEETFSVHQSGHNSGVIHTGIYYAPNSVKARLCVEGSKLAYRYCEEKNIPFKKCGKLIIATENKELPALSALYERGKKNGVADLTILNTSDMQKIEPNCTGFKAIWSPSTGIVNWANVNAAYGEDCRESGADIYFNFHVNGFHFNSEETACSTQNFPLTVLSDNGAFHCKYVVTCAGLYADKLAVMSGCNPEPKIVPFRGEYLILKPDRSDLVKTNIYPVPNPQLPFLGVHFTPRIDGTVWLGPNAVLAFRREGYKWNQFNFLEFWDTLTYSGFQKLMIKHASFGLRQIYEAMSVKAQVRQLQKYVPKLHINDVIRGPSGVRAQALDKNGELVDDFIFDASEDSLKKRILHVRNAPSPAATSSLAIAKVIANKVEKHFHL